MLFSTIASASLLGLTAAAPFSFPLSNGFPTIVNPSSQLTTIELQAHGTLPNGTPPPTASKDAITSLQLIAFNELFEVAFFTELLANITNVVPGYEIRDPSLNKFVTDAITAVVAQEELHALNANGALKHFGAAPIQPCQYNIPVSDFTSAIALASTFTDVVLGTLQDVVSKFALSGDDALIRGVASVIGQEGEQNGFYRTHLMKTPSALPFLTTSTREFAFSALNQNFVVAGTCPNIGTINLPIFGALTLDTPAPILPQTQQLNFEFHATDAHTNDYSSLSLVYINQQNVPIVEPLNGIYADQYGKVSFSANFPFTANELNGLTIAVLTKTAGPFTSADDVAAATVLGPALIEVN